jgi:hypothetical protein
MLALHGHGDRELAVGQQAGAVQPPDILNHVTWTNRHGARCARLYPKRTGGTPRWHAPEFRS